MFCEWCWLYTKPFTPPTHFHLSCPSALFMALPLSLFVYRLDIEEDLIGIQTPHTWAQALVWLQGAEFKIPQLKMVEVEGGMSGGLQGSDTWQRAGTTKSCRPEDNWRSWIEQLWRFTAYLSRCKGIVNFTVSRWQKCLDISNNAASVKAEQRDVGTTCVLILRCALLAYSDLAAEWRMVDDASDQEEACDQVKSCRPLFSFLWVTWKKDLGPLF